MTTFSTQGCAVLICHGEFRSFTDAYLSQFFKINGKIVVVFGSGIRPWLCSAHRYLCKQSGSAGSGQE